MNTVGAYFTALCGRFFNKSGNGGSLAMSLPENPFSGVETIVPLAGAQKLEASFPPEFEGLSVPVTIARRPQRPARRTRYDDWPCRPVFGTNGQLKKVLFVTPTGERVGKVLARNGNKVIIRHLRGRLVFERTLAS